MGRDYRSGIIPNGAANNNSNNQTKAAATAGNAQKVKKQNQDEQIIEYAKTFVGAKLEDNKDILSKVDKLSPELQDKFYTDIYPIIITFESNLITALNKQADISMQKQKQLDKQRTCDHIFGDYVYKSRTNLWERVCPKCKYVDSIDKDPNQTKAPQRGRDTRISRRNDKPYK